MAIVTLRLNDQEEKILEMLVRHFDEDKSKILKDALWEMYEELRDRELIEEFETKLDSGKVQFGSADALLGKIAEKTPTDTPKVERPARRGKGRPRKK